MTQSLQDDIDLLLQGQLMPQDCLWPISFSDLDLVLSESSEDSNDLSPDTSKDSNSNNEDESRLSPVERKTKRRVQVASSARRHRARKKVSAA